jgi:hypothetical protein
MATMATDLRMLSVRQPHAWAILSGNKDVKNRTWEFPYEMPCTIGIQAGVRIDPDGLDGPAEPPDDLPLGVALGVVNVSCDHESSECLRSDGTLCSPWAVAGWRHWVLAHPRSLDQPIPCRGFLNLFRPPPDVADALGGLVGGR